MVVINVLGMHRSGTSLLASMLAESGVFPGPEDKLIPKAADNPTGFWEYKPFSTINRELLGMLGGSWDVPPPIYPRWTSIHDVSAYRDRVYQHIEEDFAEHEHWLWKDPRNCLTIEFWNQVIPEAKPLIIVRHPLEIALSLSSGKTHTRELPSLLGVNLWQKYYSVLTSVVAPEDATWVHYDKLVQQPHDELQRLLVGLGIDVEADVATKATERANPQDRESRFGVADVPAELVDDYLRYCELAGYQPNETSVQSTISQFMLAKDRGARNLLDRYQQKVDVANAQAKRLQDQVQGLQTKTQNMEQQITTLQAEQKDQIATLQAEQKDQIATLQAEQKDQIATLQAEQEANRKAHQDEQRKLQQRSVQEVRRRQVELDNLRQRLHDTTLELDYIKSTNSYKLTVRWWGLKYRIMPPGSRQERGYYLVRTSVITLFTKGPITFTRMMIAWLRGERRYHPKIAITDGNTTSNGEGLVLFDDAWYQRQNHDVTKSRMTGIYHYVNYGEKEDRNPSLLFDVRWYRETHKLPRAESALKHFETTGIEQGLAPSRPFAFAATGRKFTLDELQGLVESIKGASAKITHLSVKSTSFDFQQEAAYLQKLMDGGFVQQAHNKKPSVSVVMPTRDRKQFVTKAIQSVIAQSYPHWELLIVDDGSTDGTSEMLAELYDDERIKVLQTTGLGVSGARNVGLQNATGDIIAYLDSDNVWLPHYLETMLASFQMLETDILFAALAARKDEGQTYYRGNVFDWDSMLKANYVDLNIFIHRRGVYEQLGGFDETMTRMVDWELILRYTRKYGAVYVPVVGANYDDTDRADRITIRETEAYQFTIRNKYMIDWADLERSVGRRDQNLVSIVIPVLNQIDLTEQCLQSLLSVEAGVSFEIVLVNNGSDTVTTERLYLWEAVVDNLRVVRNFKNLNFALGCNLGAAASRGRTIVFLNNDTQATTPNWLANLVRPLDQPDVGVVQPKLLYPDRTVQCMGVVFAEQGTLGYPIYQNAPEHAAHVNKSRKFQAVTAACMAVHAADFVRLGGFDPIYRNGQEDVDFCLRLQENTGKTGWYAADSSIIHHESKTPGRGTFIMENRYVFIDRWEGRIQPDDFTYYADDGFEVINWVPDANPSAPVYRANLKAHPAHTPRPSANGRVHVALKISCPREELKAEWGDYHFAQSLGAALERQGYSYRIDFMDGWYTNAQPSDVNLVLRGISEYKPNPQARNMMWLISHPDKVTAEEIRQYETVFVASAHHANRLRLEHGEKIVTLLQCTDAERFTPTGTTATVTTDCLFVGNSRNVFRPSVKYTLEKDISLTVYGTRWPQFIDEAIIGGENIPNTELPQYYRGAKVVLNDHWDDMRDMGYVSNRIFDVLACGAALVTDRVEGLPESFEPFIYIFHDADSLQAAVTRALADLNEPIQQEARKRFTHEVRSKHSFDERARTLLTYVQGEPEAVPTPPQAKSTPAQPVPSTAFTPPTDDGPHCNICGNKTFGRGPGGRVSPGSRMLPRCEKCGSLERHRAQRTLWASFSQSFLGARSVLQFSKDSSIEPSWFRKYEVSIYGVKNTLDIQNIDRPDGNYDIVVASHVLEHVPDDKAAMREIMRILTPNGFAFIAVPNPMVYDTTDDWGYPIAELHEHYRMYGKDISEKFDEIVGPGNWKIEYITDPITGLNDCCYLLAKSSKTLAEIEEALVELV